MGEVTAAAGRIVTRGVRVDVPTAVPPDRAAQLVAAFGERAHSYMNSEAHRISRAWLSRILEARDFPLARLARCLELLAQTTRERVPDVPQIAERAQHGADFIASHETFLGLNA
jgi:hypothetical protein